MKTPTKPQVPPEELIKTLKNEFGVITSSVELLNGYDDLNYMVKEAETDRKYLLKVYNDSFSQNTMEIECENKTITYLHSRGFPVPNLLQSQSGQFYHIYTDVNGNPSKKHIMRLHDFIPGKILGSVDITPDLCHQTGLLAAKIDEALEQLDIPTSLPSSKKSGFLWDLANVEMCGEFVSFIQDSEKRKLAIRTLDFVKEKLVPKLNDLPSQCIHGDINEQNLIVAEENGQLRVTSLIDFGDSVYSKRVFEPAIAMSYFVLFGTDAIKCTKAFIDGYHGSVKLSDVEHSLLFSCIVARIAQSVILGNYHAAKLAANGQSTEYVLVTSKKGWDTLADLMDGELGRNLNVLLSI